MDSVEFDHVKWIRMLNAIHLVAAWFFSGLTWARILKYVMLPGTHSGISTAQRLAMIVLQMFATIEYSIFLDLRSPMLRSDTISRGLPPASTRFINEKVKVTMYRSINEE